MRLLLICLLLAKCLCLTAQNSNSKQGSTQFLAGNYDVYLFTPTAIPHAHKKFTYRNRLLLCNSLRYGLSKALSIGGGLELFSLLDKNLPYISLDFKYAKSLKPNLYLAGGYSLGMVPTLNEGLANNRNVIHIPFLAITLGDEVNNLTARTESILVDQLEFKNIALGLSGRFRLGENYAFYAESHIPLNESDITLNTDIMNFGIQFFRKSNVLSLGLGYTSILSEDRSFFPAVGFFRAV